MTDISINAGLPASLIPQSTSVDRSNATDTAVQETGFFAALQSAPSTGASQYEASSRPVESASASSSASEQSGYVQTSSSAAADTAVKAAADNGTAAQTVPVYDSYSKAEKITVSPETAEELKSLLAAKADDPTAYQQAKEALEAAMLKAINDMNDPELQKEEAQEKLLLALMKFLDKLLNGEPERETALDDGEEDKEFNGILLEIVERMVESARENEKPDPDLDGNAPFVDMFVPQTQPTEETDTDSRDDDLSSKPLTGLNLLRAHRRVREIPPSLSRERARLEAEPIPVPIDPRIRVASEISVDGLQTEELLTVQAAALALAVDDVAVQSAEILPAENLQTVSEIPAAETAYTAENDITETDITDQTVQSTVPSETAVTDPSADTATDSITVSASGTQQTENTQSVSSTVNTADAIDDVTALQDAEAVEKVQDDDFIGSGYSRFTIEFLPKDSNVLTDTVSGTDESNVKEPAEAEEDLSNAPTTPDTSDEIITEAPDENGADLNANGTDTDTSDDYVPEIKENTSTDISQELSDDVSVHAEGNVTSISDGDEDAVYERMAESVYAEAISALTGKQVKTVQPAKDYAAVEKTGAAETAVLSDELDELSRLFGVKKETETKVLPIDDEETDKASEISKELPVEKISVVSSKVPDAPEARTFDLGEGVVKQVVTQIVTEVLHNLPEKDGETTLMMTLNPESLGRISVKLVENAGKLSVTIVAENKETAAMLASRYDHIQESLRDNGTQLEKYQVVYGAEQDGRAEQQNYEGSSKNPYVRQDEEHDEENDGQFRELLGDAV